MARGGVPVPPPSTKDLSRDGAGISKQAEGCPSTQPHWSMWVTQLVGSLPEPGQPLPAGSKGTPLIPWHSNCKGDVVVEGKRTDKRCQLKHR